MAAVIIEGCTWVVVFYHTMTEFLKQKSNSCTRSSLYVNAERDIIHLQLQSSSSEPSAQSGKASHFHESRIQSPLVHVWYMSPLQYV